MHDFFEHQERARRNTGWLVILFALAVICIIIMVYVAVAAILLWAQGSGYHLVDRNDVSIFDWRLLAAVGGGTVAVVAFGSLYKIAQLSSGGSVVAEMIGGRLVEQGARDASERQLLNVVEEMAIASGTPVPPVYVMNDERSINAFAAGWSPGSAVISVTRGTMENLSREELQGVIAHEFSHILNGDMRLNIRLIGILNGILVIGLTGYTVLRSMRYIGGGSRRKEGGGSAILVILLIGLALLVIGYIGVFFGKIIKAAVSRQREYLADAAAVQFTRYPEGIGGALKKIAATSRGALLANPRAEEASHMFFGQGVSVAIPLLFATHPPIMD